MSRGKFAAWLLGGLVFVVGAVTLVQQFSGFVGHFAKGIVTSQKTYARSGNGGPDLPADVSGATFVYLVPGKSPNLKMDDGKTAFDPAKGIVKYGITFTNAGTNATISQQEFPGQLKPRGGDKFMAFINNTKATRSADVNSGTLYFLPALKNGAPASGTDTVIFARDDILLFGQSASILGWDAWTQLAGSLQKSAGK